MENAADHVARLVDAPAEDVHLALGLGSEKL